MPEYQHLDQFDPSKGLDRGRSKRFEAVWYLLKCSFFLSPLPWPGRLKVWLLRRFGATVGEGVVIKPRVNIHFPWKLSLGDHVWIGEEVFILNFEPCVIESRSCISQRAFLCGGNHDFRRLDFPYRNGPIFIREQSWIGAQVFVAPNVTIGKGCVVAAGSIITQDQPEGMICSGNPCRAIRPRVR